MARVLTTQEALTQVREMERIINGDLQSNVNRLLQLTQRLTDPAVWAGGAANRYRSQAENWRSAIQNALQKVREMQDQADLINARIREAGGGLA